jgi:hypothetical protein
MYFQLNNTRQFFVWIRNGEAMVTLFFHRTRRRYYMDDETLHKENSIRKGDFHRGQKLIYKGEEAEVLGVNPVFVIKVTGKNQVVCGNILDDVSSYRSQSIMHFE